MCFDLKSKRAKRAKADIECWKMLWKDYTNLYKYVVTEVVYKKGIQMPLVKIHPSNDRIDIGYHSYRTKLDLMRGRRLYGIKSLKDSINVKCIIPKGTRYYENDTQYVSETIILAE